MTALLNPPQPPGEKPNPRLTVIRGDDVELRCRAEADQLLDMAYSWKLNGLTIRYSAVVSTHNIIVIKRSFTTFL